MEHPTEPSQHQPSHPQHPDEPHNSLRNLKANKKIAVMLGSAVDFLRDQPLIPEDRDGSSKDESSLSLNVSGMSLAAMPDAAPTHNEMHDANFPKDAEGRTYHVGAKRGEVANRIITCGDPNRARTLAKFLDGDFESLHFKTSHRGFTVITGRYGGTPVSIVSIGMGLSMMDFFVREVRNIVDGELAIIRFGSSGSIGSGKIGQISVAHPGALLISRNVDYFSDDEGEEPKDEAATGPYRFSHVCAADPALSELLEKNLGAHLGAERVVKGLNATADSFYSSQGRIDSNFWDENGNIISHLQKKYTNIGTLEMETFQLFHLARCAVPRGSVVAAAATMIFADRKSKEFIDNDTIAHLEHYAGKGLLDAIVALPIPKEKLHPDAGSVWEAAN